MNKNWFDEQYANVADTNLDGWLIGARSSQKKRLQQVVEAIRAYETNYESVLDIGCGIGILGDLIRKELNVSKYVGTDISQKAIDYANSLGTKSCFYEQSELPRVPFESNYFDLVLLVEVLYYLSTEDRQRAVENVILTMKPGGVLCISGSIANETYFTEAYFEGFFPNKLELVSTSYHYSRFYYWFEEILMKFIRLDEYMLSRPHRVQEPSNGLKVFLNNRMVAFLLRPFTYLFSMASYYLIKSIFLYDTIYKVSNFLFKHKSKSGIVKIYRKL